MPKFTISAYQEMYAELEVSASDAREAIRKFKALIAKDEITWHLSDEDMNFTISEEDSKGEIVSEVSSDSLNVLIKA